MNARAAALIAVVVAVEEYSRTCGMGVLMVRNFCEDFCPHGWGRGDCEATTQEECRAWIAAHEGVRE